MNNYALRCIESDYPTLLALAQALGVIKVVDGQPLAELGTSWDFIGYKYLGAEPIEGEPDTRTILTDTSGNRYVHINVRTTVNVRQRAEELAVENPTIAGALSQIPRFFITDAEGNATLPEFPLRVFC